MSYIQEANGNLNAAKARIQNGIEAGARAIDDTQLLVNGLAQIAVGIDRMGSHASFLSASPPEVSRIVSEAGAQGGVSKVSYEQSIQFLDAAMGDGPRHPHLVSAQGIARRAADTINANFEYDVVKENIPKIGQLVAELARLTQETSDALLLYRAGIMDARGSIAPGAVEKIEAYQDIADWPKA